MTQPEYSGYYKFADEELHMKLRDEIAPHFRAKPDKVSLIGPLANDSHLLFMSTLVSLL